MWNLNGLFLLDKPLGARSTDCVNKFHAALLKLARLTGTSTKKIKIRVGHAGTLDSTASGLLILLVGRATRLSDYIMMLPKVYRATLRLGQATDTCDYSGQVTFQGDAKKIAKLTSSDIDKILPSFWGWRMQRPPEISALKINGRPSHKLARSGKSELKPAARPIFLRAIKRTSELIFTTSTANSNAPVAHVDLEISCSKGTYIRSLARDIGEALGCGACIESLRRISVGDFHVDNAMSLETFDFDITPEMIRSPHEVVSQFHRIALTPEAELRLSNGVATPLVGAGKFVAGNLVKPAGLLQSPPSMRDVLCVEGRNMLGFVDVVRPNALEPSTSISDSNSVDCVEGTSATVNNGLILRPRANILLIDEQGGSRN